MTSKRPILFDLIPVSIAPHESQNHNCLALMHINTTPHENIT